MAGLTIVTAASANPISTTELRDYARIDDNVDTTLIASIIGAATKFCEEYTNRSFVTQTLRLSLDGINEYDQKIQDGFHTGAFQIFYNNFIEIPKPPLISVSSIKFFDDSDTESTWATSNYYIDNVSEPARVILRDGGAYPTDLRNANGIQVNYTAGYGAASAVPEAIRVAIMQYALNLYEHRGDDEKQGFGTGIKAPSLVQNLLAPFVIRRYGVSSFQPRYVAMR